MPEIADIAALLAKSARIQAEFRVIAAAQRELIAEMLEQRPEWDPIRHVDDTELRRMWTHD